MSGSPSFSSFSSLHKKENIHSCFQPIPIQRSIDCNQRQRTSQYSLKGSADYRSVFWTISRIICSTKLCSRTTLNATWLIGPGLEQTADTCRDVLLPDFLTTGRPTRKFCIQHTCLTVRNAFQIYLYLSLPATIFAAYLLFSLPLRVGSKPIHQ